MSSLTLIECRALVHNAPGVEYVTVTAEWFKTWAGNPMQYRVTGAGPVLYYATAEAARRAAARRALKLARPEHVRRIYQLYGMEE